MVCDFSEIALAFMSKQDRNWGAYNRYNRRDRKMSLLWVKGLGDWLRRSGHLGSRVFVLDYGCGYFDLGVDISPCVAGADGFDPEAAALDLARRREDLPANSNLFSDAELIPRRKYGLVVLNSVVQYFGDAEEVRSVLIDIRDRYLTGDGGIVILSDLIPPGYTPVVDALEVLGYAIWHGCALAMLKHLWKAATKSSDFALLRIDPLQLESMARELGYELRKLERNLTPSSTRYSVELAL